jgi:MmyB-like transcription regulator ligand binding domain
VPGEILDSISRVLGLDDSQLMYLRRLAGLGAIHSSPVPEAESGALRPFTDNWMPNPAYITDQRGDVVVANDAARLLFDMNRPSSNVIRNFFTNEVTRSRYRQQDILNDPDSYIGITSRK